MADADGKIIPLVDDDQGEGIKDFLDDYIIRCPKCGLEDIITWAHQRICSTCNHHF